MPNTDEIIVDAILRASGGTLTFGNLDNPNIMPFSGVLTYLDVPSDKAPMGSNGMKVMIPESVAQTAADSLIGTPVNLAASMDDHEVRTVIGVFDKVWIGEPTEKGTPLCVEGHIFAKSFPNEAAAIKASQDTLGFSYETSKTKLVSAAYGDELVAVAESLVFTGAAILYKHVAAYGSTSLAASAGGENLPEEAVQKILDAVSALKEYVDAKFSLLAEQEWVKDIYKYVDDAYDRVAKADEAVEEAIEVAGGKPEDDVEVDVTVNVLAGKGANPTPAAAAETAEDSPAVKTLTELVATMQKEINDLKAAKETELAAAAAQQPKRLSLNSTQLIAKFDKKSDPDELMASVDAKNLPVVDSMAAKLTILNQHFNK